MKSLTTYIVEKYKISKSTPGEEYWKNKKWIVYVSSKVSLQYPQEFFIYYIKNSKFNIYVFSDDELKDLYENNPGVYPDYFIFELDKEFFNHIIYKLLNNEIKIDNVDKLIKLGTGRYINTIIDEKYIARPQK